MKNGKIDGEKVDLSNFTLSQSSLERNRNNNREQLALTTKREFAQNIPKHCALHWDGKMMKNILGESVEWESILVSGAPHYNEGKLISVTSLTDDWQTHQYWHCPG